MNKPDLVQVYQAADKNNAELVKSYLEAHEIKAFIEGNPGPEGAILGRFGGRAPFNPWLVYVLERKAEETEDLLEDFEARKTENGRK
ncbi:MAG: hypothetical protein V5A57_02025 [Candidatus Paceibacterota bacterium]